MNHADVEKSLEGLRTGLKQDGADIVVEAVDADRIELSLVFSANACMECIVNSEIMTALVKAALSKDFAKVPKIVLNDPRVKKQ